MYFFCCIRNWLSEAKSLASPEHAQEFGLDNLEKEISMLEKELSRDDQTLGFCHNDLQYGNIMIDEKTRSITFIVSFHLRVKFLYNLLQVKFYWFTCSIFQDYEYSSYNPIAYDFANHFCEMAANYHTDTPHILNYNAYPGKQTFIYFLNDSIPYFLMNLISFLSCILL